MLNSIPARIVGSKIVWLGSAPPALDEQASVMIVWDDARRTEIALPQKTLNAAGGVDVRDLAGRLTWQGDALAEQRAQRDGW